MDGPSASATLSRSFPQPADVDEEPEESDDDAGDSQEEQEQDKGDGEVNELEAQATREETDDGNPTTNHPEEEPPNPKPKQRATFKDRLGPKKSNDKPRSLSFITAPTKQRKSFKSRLTPVSSAQSPPASSFVTAKENVTPRKNVEEITNDTANEQTNTLQPPPFEREDSPTSPISATQPRSSSGDITNQATGDSTVALLPQGIAGRSASASPNVKAKDAPQAPSDDPSQVPKATAHGMVRFNVTDKVNRNDARTATTLSQAGRRRIWKRSRQGSSHPGEIVKMEKMLVRVDSTMQDLPSDYNENDSLKTSARTIEKWREFVVVCRERAQPTTQTSRYRCTRLE